MILHLSDYPPNLGQRSSRARAHAGSARGFVESCRSARMQKDAARIASRTWKAGTLRLSSGVATIGARSLPPQNGGASIEVARSWPRILHWTMTWAKLRTRRAARRGRRRALLHGGTVHWANGAIGVVIYKQISGHRSSQRRRPCATSSPSFAHLASSIYRQEITTALAIRKL